MQTKTAYHQELKEKISGLVDDLDIKDIEIGMLKNEITDTLTPNIALMRLSQYVLQMLTELNEYEQKNKLNKRMADSKQRLIKMMELTSELSGIGDRLQSLKFFNTELFGKMQLLRIENDQLRIENEAMVKAFNGI